MILHVTPRYPPLPLGGAERQLQKLAPKLAGRGIDVAVLTWDAGRRRLPRHEMLDAVPVFRLRERTIPWRGKPRLAALGWGLGMMGFLWRHRKRVRFVHVHAFSELAVFSKLWCALLSIPCAAKATGPAGILNGVGSRRGVLGKALWRLLTRSGWTIAVSPFIARQLEASGVPAERILHLPNGVDIAEGSPRRTDSERGGRVLAVSNLIPVKRLDLLIEAAAFLAPRHPALRWIVAGEGALRGRLERLSRERGVHERIEWRGYVEPIAPLFEEADVFVHPSEYEGASNSILEAMAAGLPVVVRGGGFNDHIVGDGRTGLTFDGTAGSLAGCVRRLIEDSALRRTLGDQARAAVLKDHGFSAICDQYLAILQKLGV